MFGEVEASEVVAEPIYEPVVGATVGVWRVRAGSRTSVLKLLALRDGGHPNWRAGANETEWMYWRREACAYESRLFASLGDVLRAPRCLQVANRSDGSVALWLEDLGRRSGAEWSVAEFGPAGEAFGRWQGQFIADPQLPTDRWLSRGWLHTYLAQRDVDEAILAEDQPWRRAELAEWFDRRDVDRMRAMRADRAVFLDALAKLPSVLCHLDLHPGNLFANASGTTAVIDWAYVGVGSVGEDVGNLVPDSVLDFHVPVEQIQMLDDELTDAYNRGLAGIGAIVEPNLVRLGMTATMAAKYAWIAPAMTRSLIDERPSINGRPAEEAVRTWAPAVQYLLERADEARALNR